MTYYEELGVPADAPLTEIRRAYRTLARQRHPDSQSEQHLKSLAERQMQRLNEILTILSDPVERQRYDRSLLDDRDVNRAPGAGESAAGGRSGVLVRFVREHFTWVAIGIMAVITVCWCVLAGSPRLQDAAPRPIPHAETAAAPLDPHLPGGGDAKPPDSPFAGRWLYDPQAVRSSGSTYPFEFAELFLTQPDGGLEGEFYARYPLNDGGAPPEIRLRLRGTASHPTSAVLNWVSSQKAEGDAELILRSSNTMTFSWRTTVPGSQRSPSSGVIWLVRGEGR